MMNMPGEFTAFSINADEAENARRLFAKTCPANTFCEHREFALNLAGVTFIDSVAEAAGGGKIVSWSAGTIEIHVPNDRTPQALIQILIGGRGYADEDRRHNFTVFAVGEREYVLGFFNNLREKYGDARIATVSWWYNSGNGSDYTTVPIETPLPVHDEFYPWLSGGVDAYLQRYLEDSATVLFMMGPAGTGKTSLLRHFIYTHNLSATITYEEKLLGSDELFVNFLTRADKGVLIIEDADLMVGSRESEGNKLIGRFLNVSDGVIKTSGKKIVFTTNLGDFRHVDPALVRAGRCFDAVRFRALTASEASAAAAAAGVPDPGRECSLAELFGRQATTIDLAPLGF